MYSENIQSVTTYDQYMDNGNIRSLTIYGQWHYTVSINARSVIIYDQLQYTITENDITYLYVIYSIF